MLRAELLGGLALSWDGEPTPPIPGRAARSLLAYLLTYRDRPHTRDLLAGTFWPDLPDDVARRRLSQALWQVRQGLGSALAPDQLIVTEGDTLQILPDPALALWIDIEAFAVGIAEAERRERHDAEGLQRLAESVELYRGGFLEGYYDDWTVPERERLHELLVQALLRLVDGHKARSEFERALAFARRLAEVEPWREKAHREVMRLCHGLGLPEHALRQFGLCTAALAEELGVDPSPETCALADEIANRAGLAESPHLPLTFRPVVAPRLERPHQLPLVGRDKEMMRLLRVGSAALQGQGGLVILHGEAGVGKTRLLSEACGELAWLGMTVLWGRCYELAAPPAYQPLVEVLRAGLPAVSGPALEPLWRAELSRLLPELLDTAGESLPPPLSPQDEQRRLLEAIARGFLALGRMSPHLIVLEDVHWMDTPSLEALRYLLPRLPEARLAIVASVRSEELAGEAAEALAAMESTRLARRVELDRLDKGATWNLVEHCLGLEQPAPRFSDRLYAVTEGNPYFVVETLWALVDEGLLYRDDESVWSTPWDGTTADYAELPLAEGVAQSITRRLDRLPDRLDDPLNVAAVIGRQVDFPLWLAASGSDEDGLLEAADELCARRVLMPVTGDGDYAFAHDQIRRVAYGRLAVPRRRVYHRRVATALTAQAPGEPEPLAYHWTQAGVWDQAAVYHERAAERAQAVYANARAVWHYSQALEMLAQTPGGIAPAEDYRLRLARERLLHRMGDRAAQIGDLQTLEALAEALDDDRRRAKAALHRASYGNSTGDYPLALAAAGRAATLAARLPDAELEASSHLAWGLALRSQGNYPQAREQFDRALALSRAAGLRQVEAESYAQAGVVAWYIGDLDGARSCFERALEISRELGSRREVGRMTNNLALIAASRGDFAHARSLFEQALKSDREVGDRAAESRSLGNLGSVLGDLGLYAEAETIHQQALSLCRAIGNRQTEAVQLGNLSLTWHELGDHERARDAGQQVLALGQEMGDRVAQAYGWTYLALALRGLGALDEAAAAYREAQTLRRQLGQPEMVAEVEAGLARVALARGDLAAALAHVEEVLAQAESGILLGADQTLTASLHCYEVLAACQDPRAERILRAACRLIEERAAGIKDPEVRRAFTENHPRHRALLAAYCAMEGGPGEREEPPGAPGVAPGSAGVRTATLSLPRVDAPLGRPLRDDEHVTITWTVAAPDDEAIAAKVARRHHRLVRLLREAQSQGAAPTHQHLADALGVTRRTIERDMASLHAEYPDLPPTRGKMSD